MKMLTLLFSLLISFSGIANAEISFTFENSLTQYLNTHKQAASEWATLQNLGWKFQIDEANTPSGQLRILIGNPLTMSSFSELKQSPQSLVIFVNPQSESPRAEMKIIKQFFVNESKELIKDISLQHAFILKWGSSMQSAADIISKKIGWPDDDIDALGKGYQTYFKKYKRLSFPYGDQAWQIKKNHQPSDFFLNLLHGRKTYTSGCSVTLGVLLNLGGFLLFDDTSIYDKNFPDLFINNTTFYSTEKSFFRSPKKDTKGNLTLQSHWALIGQPAYIEAITEDVADEDYFGENVIITSTTPKALSELKANGLGYYSSSYVRTEKDFKKFKGISKKMLQWWVNFHSIYKKLKTQHIKRSELKNECISNNVVACKAVESMSTEKMRLIESPFFTETLMFGHPGGFKTLKEWVIELNTINPDTPYGLMFYDYSPLEKIFPKYIQAFQ